MEEEIKYWSYLFNILTTLGLTSVLFHYITKINWKALPTTSKLLLILIAADIVFEIIFISHILFRFID